MVTLMILAVLGILYVLIVLPWPVPLLFRMFLGLIISWPLLTHYGSVSLPAGVPDLHYQRGYFGLLMICIFFSIVVARRYGRAVEEAGRHKLATSAATASQHSFPAIAVESIPGYAVATSSKALAATSIDETGQPASGLRRFDWFPFPVQAYVVMMGFALLNGLRLTGDVSTAIAAYIDTVLLPVGMYFMAKRLIISRKRLAWAMGALIVAALIVCLTGLYERVLDLTESAFPISPHDELGNTRYLGVPGGRASGVMGSPSVYGGIVGLGMLCSLCCLVHIRNAWLKLLVGCVALLLAYGVIVSFTRSAWISVSIALLFSQFYFKGLWKVTLPILIGCSLAVILMWDSLHHSEIVQNRIVESGNVVGRVERFMWSWDRVLERPILGRGHGSLDKLMQREFLTKGFSTSHNSYMTMLVDHGVLAFGCFFAVVLGWMSKGISVLRKKPNDRFEHGTMAVMIGLLSIWLLSGMSLELTDFTYYTSLFWIAGAVIERLNYEFAGPGLGSTWLGQQKIQESE